MLPQLNLKNSTYKQPQLLVYHVYSKHFLTILSQNSSYPFPSGVHVE